MPLGCLQGGYLLLVGVLIAVRVPVPVVLVLLLDLSRGTGYEDWTYRTVRS